MALPAPLALFALVGIGLLAGFVGHLLFQRFRVSDVILLLFVGAFLGPVFHVLDPSLLAPALPFLAPLGLSLVLFEGGLELSYGDLRKHAGRGLAMTIATWSATAIAVAVVAHAVVGLSWTLAFLLSTAVSATGIFVVIPLLKQMRAPADAKVALTLETAVGDLLSAVVVTAFAGILALGMSPQAGVTLFALKFVIGAAVGVLAGVVWGRALHLLGAAQHGFPLTLAALVLTYAITEALHGSGYLAALTFGLFLGNAPALVRFGGLQKLAPPTEGLRHHQGEIVFILRSIYFVYVGLAISPAVFTWNGILIGAAFVAAMLVARVAAVMVSTRGRTPAERSTRGLLIGMMPRGLATVIVASIPAAMGIPGTERFLEYTFLILVGCDIATSVMLWGYQTKAKANAKANARDDEVAPAPAP